MYVHTVLYKYVHYMLHVTCTYITEEKKIIKNVKGPHFPPRKTNKPRHQRPKQQNVEKVLKKVKKKRYQIPSFSFPFPFFKFFIGLRVGIV